MREYSYSVFVAPEVEAVDEEGFREHVQRILAHQQGWAQWRYTFTYEPQHTLALSRTLAMATTRHFTLVLTPNDQISRYGPEFRGMSIANCSENYISINEKRWKTGAKPNPDDPIEGMSLEDYRMYVVLHEVGHILSNCSKSDHKTRCAPSGKAPIMMQQTNGVGKGCAPNTFPIAGIDNVGADSYHANDSADVSSE